MIKRVSKYLSVFLAVGSLLIVLAVAGGVWRLSNGPISLSVLVGTIEGLINENTDNLTVEIDDVILEKAEDSWAARLRFVNLVAYDQNKKIVAKAPRAALRVTVDSLLSGVFTPSYLELIGPRILLHRQMDGGFRLGFGGIGQSGKVPAASNEAASKNATTKSIPSDKSLTGEAVPENAEDMMALLRATLLSGETQGAVANLSEIKIIRADLTLFDEPNGTTWVLPKANLLFLRADDGLNITLNADIVVGEEKFGLVTRAKYLKSTHGLTLDVTVRDVNPQTLAKHVPELKMLKFMHFPVSGSASIEVSRDGRLAAADMDINLGSGNFVFGRQAQDGIGLSSGRISLGYSREKKILVLKPSQLELSGGKAGLSGFITPEGTGGRPFSKFGYNLELSNIKIAGENTKEIDRIIGIGAVDVDQAHVAFETAEMHIGDARISFNGSVKAGEKAPDVKLSGHIENVATAKILEIWPHDLGAELRQWVVVTLDAFIPSGRFAVDIAGEELTRLIEGGTAPKNFLKAEFDVTKGSFEILKGLPFVKKASGRGVLTDSDFNFHADAGEITVASGKKVTLKSGEFHTNWAASDPVVGTMHIIANGPISAVMELVDNKPLQFASKMGVKPKTLGGRAIADVLFTMPLIADLPVAKVGVKAKIKLVGMRVPKAFNNVDLTNANLNLDITKYGLKGKGTMELKGVKARLEWAENFGLKGKRSSEFRFKTVLDKAARQKMGFDFSAFLRGPVGVDLTLKGKGGGKSRQRACGG